MVVRIFIILFFFIGCSTTAKKGDHQQVDSSGQSVEQPETIRQQIDALEKVAESISQQDLSPEQIKRAAKQIQKDPEAQTAVKAITNALQGQKIKAKYSPSTGRRYSADLEYDPETGEKLLSVE